VVLAGPDVVHLPGVGELLSLKPWGGSGPASGRVRVWGEGGLPPAGLLLPFSGAVWWIRRFVAFVSAAKIMYVKIILSTTPPSRGFNKCSLLVDGKKSRPHHETPASLEFSACSPLPCKRAQPASHHAAQSKSMNDFHFSIDTAHISVCQIDKQTNISALVPRFAPCAFYRLPCISQSSENNKTIRTKKKKNTPTARDSHPSAKES